MTSPKLVTSVIVAGLLLCLTGCIGFSSGQKSSQLPADFSIGMNPGSVTVLKGASTTATASISAQGSFSGTVELALSGAPSGVTASLSSNAVNTSGDTTVSIAVSKSAAAGTYQVTLFAASGSLSHSTTVTLVVSSTTATPDFSISAAPASQTIAPGQSTSFNVNVAALYGFTGPVSLTASGLPSGMQASFNPASISTAGAATLNLSTTNSVATGAYTLTIAGASGTLTHSTTVTVTVTATAPPPDFSISAAPASQSVAAGNSTSFSVTVSAINGFTGTVGLAESGMPAGMLASCTPSSITGSGTCTLNVTTTSSTATGTYTLTITGTNGNLVHSTIVKVTVTAVTAPPDFTLSVSPSSQSITAGNSTTYTATVSALNGFTGTVSLSTSTLPAGITGTFSPASITKSGSSTLTLTSSTSTAAGTYGLTLSGTSGVLAHSKNASVVVAAAIPGAAMNVMQFPGATSDPWFKDVPTYLFNNPTVNGATIAIEWGGVDQGPSAGSSQYDWSYYDGIIQPWITAGKKVNIVTWAVADNSNNICGPQGQYGSPNIGNCAIPTYIWNLLGSSNETTCTSQYGTQQMPNYLATPFQTNYQAFFAAVIQHYGNNPNIGYIRFGLGHGGETIPVAGWYDTTTACGQAYVNQWGVTVQTWENYLSSMLNYEATLNSPVQLMVGITPLGIYNSGLPAYVAGVAVPLNIGFGSQGLQESDVNNCSGSSANWCTLFSQYTPQVPLELQTVGQSCPDKSCPTGSLADIIPFAVANHATVFEIYYEDWLVAYDPNYPGYYPAYQPVLKAAAGK